MPGMGTSFVSQDHLPWTIGTGSGHVSPKILIIVICIQNQLPKKNVHFDANSPPPRSIPPTVKKMDVTAGFPFLLVFVIETLRVVTTYFFLPNRASPFDTPSQIMG